MSEEINWELVLKAISESNSAWIRMFKTLNEKIDNLTVKILSSEEKGSEVRSAAHTEVVERAMKGEDIIFDIPIKKDLEGEKENGYIPRAVALKRNDQLDSKPSKTERKYKISGTSCKYCEGIISCDEYDAIKKKGKAVHVDGDGYKIGDGSCPNWRD